MHRPSPAPDLSRRTLLQASGAAGVLASTAGLPQAVSAQATPTAGQRWDDLIALPIVGGYPTPEAEHSLLGELQFQRAVQTWLWALPAINLEAMRVGQERQFGAGANVLVIWKDRPDAKTIIATANPDVIYAMGYLDLAQDGPIVFEAPPNLQGLLDDAWQRPLTDIGFAGPDGGNGGNYLVLPPGYTGEIPDGYFVLNSPTNSVFVFLRAFLEDGKTEPGAALLEQCRIYPLSQQDAPPAMEFPNGSGVPVNLLPAYDASDFASLADIFEREPVAPEDFAMRGMAASLGIIKGQPFAPDAETRTMLDAAAQVGFRMASAVAYADDPRARFYPDRYWHTMFTGSSPIFHAGSYLNLDPMIFFFRLAFSTSPAMVDAMPGKGSQYLGGFYDADGEHLLGERSYRLHVPANVPAANYWSVVLYDTDTASLLDNGQPFPSIASNTNLTTNADGSADLYFGPEPPPDAGADANWIATVPGKGWFAGVRL